MNAEGNFVEIGDCAYGIDWELRTRLWELMDYKTGEDDQAVWVKPMVVCTVQYTDLFKGRNKVYSYDEKQGYQHIGTTELARLRSPRLMDFRSDKRVTPEDLRVEQLPLDFWKDVWAISKSLGRGE
jgi:ATP-dependent DNA ligase